MNENMLKIFSLLLLAASPLFLAGCTTTQQGTALGAGIGAGTGAIIGHQSGHATGGALIGAAAGGIAGALIGQQMETKYCPVCGKGYTSGYEYCPADGALLKTKGQAASEASQPDKQTTGQTQETTSLQKTKYCSSCGIQYSQDYEYCTKDGSKLMPIK